jgi:hypothetical protein
MALPTNSPAIRETTAAMMGYSISNIVLVDFTSIQKLLLHRISMDFYAKSSEKWD